jgi:hypothetical protein
LSVIELKMCDYLGVPLVESYRPLLAGHVGITVNCPRENVSKLASAS